jgi:putative transposase
VIETDDHLLTVLRYVEANPLRAGIVTDLAAYPWSSYLVHGIGKETALVAEAPAWASLAKTETARQTYWRKWVHTPTSARELQGLRGAVSSGRPYGTARWVEATAQQLCPPLTRKRNCQYNT